MIAALPRARSWRSCGIGADRRRCTRRRRRRPAPQRDLRGDVEVERAVAAGSPRRRPEAARAGPGSRRSRRKRSSDAAASGSRARLGERTGSDLRVGGVEFTLGGEQRRERRRRRPGRRSSSLAAFSPAGDGDPGCSSRTRPRAAAGTRSEASSARNACRRSTAVVSDEGARSAGSRRDKRHDRVASRSSCRRGRHQAVSPAVPFMAASPLTRLPSSPTALLRAH